METGENEIRVLDDSKPLIPFKFQARLIRDSIEQAKKSDKKSVFTVSPPGSGKTLIMAEIAKLFTNKINRKCLFIVHRTEIVQQAEKTFARQGVNMDNMKFGMIETFRNHIPELKEFAPDVILVDEAHHAAAKSYMKVIKAFPKAVKFYFTATPWRGDGKGFEELANNDDLILGPSVNDLIENHYLAPFDYYVKTLYDKKALKMGLGDYTKKSIEQQAKTIDIDQIIDTYLTMGSNEQAIVYAGSIEQSKSIVKAFNSRGIKAAHLDGASKEEIREKTLDDFKKKKIKVISNVQIFTEGVDLPDASVALIARPTMSVALYYQFAMRVLRYKEGKRAKIIDFAGVANDLGLPNADREWSLLRRDTKWKEKKKKRYLWECPSCKRTFDNQQIKRDMSIDKNNNVTLRIYCPIDNTLIDEKFAAAKTPEMVELQQIIDEKEFSDNWYANAEIARDQSLKMNAKILKTQDTNHIYKDTDIFVKLLKLYIPDFSKNTPYSVVKAVKGFRRKEIDNMISYLNDGKDNRDEYELFVKMFKARKSIVEHDYARKTDLNAVEDDKEFIELFRSKVQIIKHSIEDFGEAASKDAIIKQLSQNLVANLKLSKDERRYFSENYSALIDRMVLFNLVNQPDGQKLFNYGMEYHKNKVEEKQDNFKKFSRIKYRNRC